MHYMFGSATTFNQDLSGWCVALIPSEPGNFDTGATSWTLPDYRPVWGTCPNCPSADLTDDCTVDYEDFAVFAEHWLEGTTP